MNDDTHLLQISRFSLFSRHIRLPFSILLAITLLLSACAGSEAEVTVDNPPLNAGAVEQSAPDASPEADQDPEPTLAGPSGQEISSPISGVNPCDLLTTEEVAAAFGEPLGSETRDTVFTYESCNFESQSGSKFIILQVTQQNAEQFKQDNEETSAMFEAELASITGLGDEAVFYSGLLRVRKGDTVVQFATWHSEAERDQALSMTQGLAALALTRLP